MSEKIAVSIVSGCLFAKQVVKSLLLNDKEQFLLAKDLTYDELLKDKVDDIDIVLFCAHTLNVKGLQVLHNFYLNNPKVKIIVFNVSLDDFDINSLLALGIKGFIYENDNYQSLIRAIKKVYAGELWVKRDLMARYIESINYYDSDNIKETIDKNRLTSRENEILFLIAQGNTNSEIASQLNISLQTVKTHIYHIYKKINIKSRSEAASYLIGKKTRSRISKNPI